MSKIEQLIKELCPGGVKYSKICNIADTFIGLATSVTKHKVEKGVLLLHNSDIQNGYIKLKTVEYLNPEFVKKNSSKILKTNDIITVHTGDVGTSAIINDNFDGCIGFTTISSRVKDYTVISPKFLCCFLNSEPCKRVINILTISDRNNLNLQAFDNIEIPLPPLPIQEEIVRILDTFTEAQANLEQELELRKKQYEYYRNQLLTFDENDSSVKWMTLGDCGKMIKGNGILKSDFVDSGVPCIHYGQLHTYYGLSATSTISYISEGLAKKSRFAHKGDLVIATTSEDVEACCKACAWLGEEAVAVSGDAHIFVHDQNPKYMAYLFRTNDFAKQKQVAATGAKVTRVSGDNMLKFKFLFPSKERQQEIVSILDKFESAIQTLEEELALRKKQYEYYREKLLTFN